MIRSESHDPQGDPLYPRKSKTGKYFREGMIATQVGHFPVLVFRPAQWEPAQAEDLKTCAIPFFSVMRRKIDEFESASPEPRRAQQP